MHYELCIPPLVRHQRILHQRADGHRTDAAWNGGDEGTLWGYILEIYVAGQAEAALAGSIRNAGSTHINDDSTILHHIGSDKAWFADCRDDDVSLATFLLQVGRVGVTYGDGSVAIFLLHHELCHWLAHDVGTSEDNTLLSAGRDVVTLQERYDAQWGSGDEARESDGHASHIDGMEAVNILAVVDGLDNLLLVDMLRQRQLYYEAVNVGIVIEAVDTLEELCLGDVILVTYESGLKAACLTGKDFILDICLRTTIVAYENCCQVGTLATTGYYVVYFLSYFCLNSSGCRLSVDKLHFV